MDAGYQVIGVCRNPMVRRDREYLQLHNRPNVTLRYFDAQDSLKLNALFDECKPVEIYNLAGDSSITESFIKPVSAVDSNIKVALNCLEYVRTKAPEIKYFNACSSECFGKQGGAAASETTPFQPISPYAVGKACAYSITKTYRDLYGIFACSAILFNHESRFRGSQFVSQKIVSGARLIAEKRMSHLELGDLTIERDWGWAPEYVDGIYRIMQFRVAEDFVLATGESNKLSTFVDAAFSYYGLDWENWVVSTPRYFRPVDIEKNCGNPSKARRELGWVAKYRIKDIVTDIAGGAVDPLI